MTQQMLGDANANTFQIKSGMGDVLVQGGGGDDLLVVDWSHKASAVTSYSAWGPHSHGPAWLQSGTDHVGYGEVATATDFAQFSRLLMKAGAGSDTIWGGAVSNEIHGGAGNDQIYGLVGADQLYGDAGNDTLYGDGQYGVGGGGADQLFGGAGNDTLVGGAGNDKLDGGVGTDTAVFSGNRANYQVGSDGHGHVTVTDLTGADGTDTLTSIEKVQFADGTWSVNSQGVLAAAASASASASAGGHGAAPASHDWHLMG